MFTPPADTDLKAHQIELNVSQVQRTLDAATHVVLPQHTVMFTLYRGELVTFAQALEMREAGD